MEIVLHRQNYQQNNTFNSIHENWPSYKNKVNNTNAKKNTQKFNLIKTIVANHGVFDELNFTFLTKVIISK